jgi:hypothetical protein
MRSILRACASKRSWAARPATVLIMSSVITLVFIVGMSQYIWLIKPIPNWVGESRYIALLAYQAPIVFAFVPYLCDRIHQWDRLPWWQWMIELLILGLALLRVVLPVPYYSGHALFLAYALFTLSSWTSRCVFLAVLVDVVYFKLTFIHDATLLGGLLMGSIAGLGVVGVKVRSQPK